MEAITQWNYVARPIKTKEQYDEAMALVESLIDCEDNTPEMELLELVSILVHEYEQRVFPVENPDPIEAIKYQMEELGVSKVELANLVGGKGRLSELLSRKRPISIQQIKALSSRLEIPADILLAAA